MLDHLRIAYRCLQNIPDGVIGGMKLWVYMQQTSFWFVWSFCCMKLITFSYFFLTLNFINKYLYLKLLSQSLLLINLLHSVFYTKFRSCTVSRKHFRFPPCHWAILGMLLTSLVVMVRLTELCKVIRLQMNN